jgi:broad specificity phosphatase PhoE
MDEIIKKIEEEIANNYTKQHRNANILSLSYYDALNEGLQRAIEIIKEGVEINPAKIFGMTFDEIRQLRAWKLEKNIDFNNLNEGYKKGFEDCKTLYMKAIQSSLDRALGKPIEIIKEDKQ